MLNILRTKDFSLIIVQIIFSLLLKLLLFEQYNKILIAYIKAWIEIWSLKIRIYT